MAKVNCGERVFTYGGRMYGPGLVIVKDAEAAKAIESKSARLLKQDAEEERRRLQGGAPPAPTSFGDADEGDEEETSTSPAGEEDEETVESLMRMSKADLLTLANDRGLDVDKSATK